jgi:hypothetical protein
MNRIITIITILCLSSACNNTTNETTIENPIEQLKIKSDSANSNHINQIIADNQSSDTLNNEAHDKLLEKNKNQKDLPISYHRYIEFPGDANWNGKPMIQQLEMSQNILKEFPDTLSRLAILNYNNYDRFFPKAIADNFEVGTSHEYVIYPKILIVRFQVFNDEFSDAPYLTKDITIKRNENGEPYAE